MKKYIKALADQKYTEFFRFLDFIKKKHGASISQYFDSNVLAAAELVGLIVYELQSADIDTGPEMISSIALLDKLLSTQDLGIAKHTLTIFIDAFSRYSAMKIAGMSKVTLDKKALKVISSLPPAVVKSSHAIQLEIIKQSEALHLTLALETNIRSLVDHAVFFKVIIELTGSYIIELEETLLPYSAVEKCLKAVKELDFFAENVILLHDDAIKKIGDMIEVIDKNMPPKGDSTFIISLKAMLSSGVESLSKPSLASTSLMLAKSPAAEALPQTLGCLINATTSFINPLSRFFFPEVSDKSSRSSESRLNI